MPTLQIPKEFFKKERQQLYANWPVAFWRELTQNSTDAGAFVITVTLEQNDGYITVRFGDDGPGISRTVMEEVYFRLGATSKGGPLDVVKLGGFGRARILTCFSMLRYSIRTQNILVTGEGAEYILEEVDETVGGCHLSIDVDDASMREMEGALRLFLRQSQLGCTVMVNGEPWTQWALRGAFVTKLNCDGVEFASVHVQPVGLLNHVIVRSKGVQSFFQISRVPKQVIIEIEPRLVRNVLTGNRDGMLLAYGRVLDEFLENITLNSSALNPKRLRDAPLQTAEASFTSEYSRPTNDDLLTSRKAPSVYLFSDSDDAKVIKLAGSYLPSNWTDAKQNTMIVWRIACQMAVDAMIQTTKMERLEWAIGWYFGESTKQAVTKRQGGLYVFCINPLDSYGNFHYANTTTHDRRLLAMAKHEVAHARYFSHDEEFATLLTELDATVDPIAFLDAVKTALSEDAEAHREKRLKKNFSEGHIAVLLIFEEHAEAHDGVLSRDQIVDLWPYDAADRGNQHPAHARLSDLTNEELWGEPIVVVAADKARSRAGKTVSLYRLTEAGRQRFRRQVPLEAPRILPALTATQEEQLQTIMMAGEPPMKQSDRKVYEGIFRAGPDGITIRDLAYSEYGLKSGMSYHDMTARPSGLQRQGKIQLIGRTKKGVKLWAATARLQAD